MNLNEDTFSNLRDKVADIKYDTQQVLDRIDSIDAAYQEMTGMEQSLLKRQKEDAVTITQLRHDVTAKEVQASAWKAEVDKLKVAVQRQQDFGQGYYDSMMTYKQQLDEAKTTMALMTDESTSDSVTIKQLYDERDMLEKNVKYLRDENERLKREKEASSGPCGCQAYRDLEEKVGDLESEVNALEQPERDKARLDRVCAPTNPVIPKDVAIAIFREGVQHGVEATCTELDNAADINIEENEYCGDFEVSFSKYIDLSDHLDTDWMRGKCGDYSEESVIDALGTLCADDEVKFTIEGLEDEKPNAD